MTENIQSRRIVIIGGGFAGVECAKTLRRRLRAATHEIVLFNSDNYLLFSPLLAEVAGGSINGDAVAVPLRHLLPGVTCRTENVQNVDFSRDRVAYLSMEGETKELAYDHIVIATGSIVNLDVIPGMADHAFSLRTVADALDLRFHVLRQLEKAEVAEDPAERSRYLSFIVVGGGFSGVEVAGEINDLLKESLESFPRIKPADIRVSLVHSRDEVLPEISKRLRAFALEKMKTAGIHMHLNSRAAAVTRRGVSLASGEFINGSTVVCTIGNTAPPLIERMAAPKLKDRLQTEPDMRLKGRRNAWAVGDCAYIVNAYDGSPSPPTGQFAERQGRQAANNIARALAGKPTAAFRFRPLGQLCSIGGRKAVANLFGVPLSGLLAWVLWRGVYLLKLPSLGRKLKVGFDWAWEAFFPRDLAHPRDAVKQLSKAYFQAGDVIFRPGDPAAAFYVIESGRVEIYESRGDGTDPEVVATLGAGDFFGEMALLDRRPHKLGARAAAATKLLVLGGNMFTSMSSAMLPLRNLIKEAVRRRTPDFWKSVPEKAELLKNLTVDELLRDEPLTPVPARATLGEALSTLEQNKAGIACVVDGSNALVGVMTWSDIFRAVEGGATASTPVSSVMIGNPSCLARGESPLTAIAMMRDHGLKGIPVVEDRDSRRLVGYLRAPRLLERLLRASPALSSPAR